MTEKEIELLDCFAGLALQQVMAYRREKGCADTDREDESFMDKAITFGLGDRSTNTYLDKSKEPASFAELMADESYVMAQAMLKIRQSYISEME